MAAHAFSAWSPSSATTFRKLKPIYPAPNSLRLHKIQTPWLETTTELSLSLHSSNFRPFIQKHRSIKSTVVFSLPTANPERGSSSSSTEKIPKWSSKAIKSFAMSELEARKLKYPTTGTEALIMGILIEGTNFASKFLRAHGITLLKVREEIVKLLGKADVLFQS